MNLHQKPQLIEVRSVDWASWGEFVANIPTYPKVKIFDWYNGNTGCITRHINIDYALHFGEYTWVSIIRNPDELMDCIYYEQELVDPSWFLQHRFESIIMEARL